MPLTTVPGDASNFERFPACSLESMPGVLRAISQRKYGYQPEPGSDPCASRARLFFRNRGTPLTKTSSDHRTDGYLFPNF